MADEFRFVPDPVEWASLLEDAVGGEDRRLVELLAERSIDRDRQLEDFLSKLKPGEAAPLPFVLVAAFDAPQVWKDAAAYVCDGYQDQVKVQEALAVQSRVLLSPGNFQFSVSSGDPMTPWLTGGQELIGQGAGATNIVTSASHGHASQSALTVGPGCRAEGITFFPVPPVESEATVVVQAEAELSNCVVLTGHGLRSAAVKASGSGVVRNCVLATWGNETGIGANVREGGRYLACVMRGLPVGAGTWSPSSAPALVADCQFDGCDTGVSIDVSGRAAHAVSGNVFYRDGGAAVVLSGSVVAGSAGCLVSGNLIVDPNRSGAPDVAIVDVQGGGGHRITGNHMRTGDTPPTVPAAVGVRVAAGCEDVWVDGNDAWGCAVTAVDDNGSGTVVGTNR